MPVTSNVKARSGLFILSDPRKHKKMCSFNLHNFDLTEPLKIVYLDRISRPFVHFLHIANGLLDG